MSADERSEVARRVCRRLSERVAEVTPTGLVHWPRTMEIVEDSSVRFLDALSIWERTGEELHRIEANAAANDVVDAWRLAADLWTADSPPRRPVPA